MRRLTMLPILLVVLVVASCGRGESSETTTAGTAPFHAIPADSVVVTGTATCVFSDGGVDPTGGDNNDLATCELDMSDPRVSGTETHDRFRYYYEEGDEAGMWVVEEAIIINSEGTWRGTAQAVDDGTPIGEANFVGEGAYQGLVFHYYFSDPSFGEAVVHGWISSGE